MPALCLALACLLFADAPVRSGPQAGDEVRTPFRPININGEFAGEPHCLVCECGLDPAVMIFARDSGEPLIKLVAKLEPIVAAHRKQSLNAFVVFLKDGEDFRSQMAKVADEKKLKHVILSTEEPAALENYEISKDADITVVLYVKSVVKANHAFKRGALDDRGIDAVLADIPKLLPAKK